MLSVERVKELIGDRSLTDEEAERIRDDLQRLAEVIFAKWEEDRRAGRLRDPQRPEGGSHP